MLRWTIIALTMGTAVTHMSLLFPDLVFILNGLGYLGLLGALYLPIPALVPHRPLVRRLLMGYTALTIGLWGLFGLRTPLGYLNKLNEVALIVALIIEERRTAMLQ